ncbi:hypothetical protein [Cecembia sp.]|uniref:hypothetical protein n=1 Tax=Cecembia sp. TaxID=1898110 RepID=UPI0025C3E1CF|nr:hypothetical protein [Cecembia sp.]
MTNRFLFYALILVVVVILVWITSETFNQPGVVDLEGEFVETAFYRNENNTGPVIRIYAVYNPDTSWNALKTYGEYMPHTKYGNTKVYFFNLLSQSPSQLSPNTPHFDEAMQEYCTGLYEKSAMGQERFVKFPFKRQKSD